MNPFTTPSADGLIVSERPEFTDAELASLARQNPSLYAKLFGQEPIRYEGGIDPDLSLIRATVGQVAA